MSNTCLYALCLLSLCTLTGCQPDKPYRIGFVGGMTGHYSVLGNDARNGVILAVEEANLAGDLPTLVEVIFRDDMQDPQVARLEVTDLLSMDVDVIIGPWTSSMAMSVVDLVNSAETLMIAPSVTTDELSGQDDYFVRMTPATSYSASCLGDYLKSHLGFQNYVAIYDERNSSFSESWIKNFARPIEEGGPESVQSVAFSSGSVSDLAGVVSQALRFAPEVVVLITTSVDTAVLAKEIRTKAPQVQIASAEAERLVQLAGRYVEGALVPKSFLQETDNPDYRRFHESYVARFNQEPGTASIQGFAATTILLQAFRDKPKGVQLKTHILNVSRYETVEGTIVLNSFGDAVNPTFVTRVENGKYERQDFQCSIPE